MVEEISHFLTNLTFVDAFNLFVFLAFTICYAYQIFYVGVSLFKKPAKLTAQKQHKFAVLIAARNEQEVIGDLIASIHDQNYPRELIDIFVIADNCDDNTAEISRQAGATKVYERHNKKQVGKGYALDYGWKSIQLDYPDAGYEAFFVFDADNLLDENYFAEMNKTYDNGAEAATSYRNSKNYDSNWISAGYALWFLREARFLSQPRMMLGTSCAISGTGFFIAARVLEQAGGWKWHLLTEDIEFSASSIAEGRTISYCPDAIIYDEQPTTFGDSWNQRFRWSKGFYQVFWNYGKKLLKGAFGSRKENTKSGKKINRFSCYDMLMTIAPGMLLTVICFLFNAVIVIATLAGAIDASTAITMSVVSMILCVTNYLLLMFILGVITTITEWESIHASSKDKLMFMFSFPLFMLTYIPIALVALFKKAAWKPIKHSVKVDVKQFAKTAKKGAGIPQQAIGGQKMPVKASIASEHDERRRK